jgi:multiple sugar transport system substrate-binding protein
MDRPVQQDHDGRLQWAGSRRVEHWQHVVAYSAGDWGVLAFRPGSTECHRGQEQVHPGGLPHLWCARKDAHFGAGLRAFVRAVLQQGDVRGGRDREPPKTWDEFVAVAKKLTDAPKRWGLAVEGASVTENSHWAFILGRQQGGSLFSKSGKPTFDSPQIVSAVKQYVDFIAKDKIASPQGAQYSTGTQAPADFANEKAAMIMFQTGTMIALTSNGMKESAYGVAPIPVPDPLPPGGEPVMSHTAGINLSVFNNTENQDGALKFVEFMTGKSQQTHLNQEYTSLPVTQAAANESVFHTDKLKVFQDIYANHSAPMPLIPDEGQMETLIGGAVKNLFAKAASTGNVSEKDVKAELAEANQKMAASGTG